MSSYDYDRSRATGVNTNKTYPNLAELMGVKPEDAVSHLITKGGVPEEEAEGIAKSLEEAWNNSEIVPGTLGEPSRRVEFFYSLFEKLPVKEEDGTVTIQPPFYNPRIIDLFNFV